METYKIVRENTVIAQPADSARIAVVASVILGNCAVIALLMLIYTLF